VKSNGSLKSAGSRRPPARDSDLGTRERLLRAAAHVFAERGHDEGTVRDVCRRAHANVAAVSYHFGSKDRLYLETLRWAMSLCQGGDTAELLSFAGRPGLSKEERLVGTVRRFALGMLAERPKWHFRLMFRELTSPTVAIDAIVREFLEPRFEALRGAIAPFLPGADDATVALHVMSVIGQILYHGAFGAVALRFLGWKTYTPEVARRIVEHVAAFTLRSLRARRSAAGRARGARRGEAS
jgi:AcrR family transcriptional regulator